jgi:hypothetical protein
MLKELVKVANELDQAGFNEEANVIDSLIRKMLDKKLDNYTYDWSVRWSSDHQKNSTSEEDNED